MLMIGLTWTIDGDRSVQCGVEKSFTGIPCHGGDSVGMTKVHGSPKERWEPGGT